MRKTRHQSFVDELHRQLLTNTVKQTDIPKNQGDCYEEDESKQDILKEIEKIYNELFTCLDDDLGDIT